MCNGITLLTLSTPIKILKCTIKNWPSTENQSWHLIHFNVHPPILFFLFPHPTRRLKLVATVTAPLPPAGWPCSEAVKQRRHRTVTSHPTTNWRRITRQRSAVVAPIARLVDVNDWWARIRGPVTSVRVCKRVIYLLTKASFTNILNSLLNIHFAGIRCAQRKNT